MARIVMTGLHPDLQEPGETIFVPSGWHHCVHNLEDTLSINHNWLNAHNVHWALALLQGEHESAVAAIEDCRCTPFHVSREHCTA